MQTGQESCPGAHCPGRQRGLQPGRQTPGQWAATEPVKGVGCADRPGTRPSRAHDGMSVTFSPDGTAGQLRWRTGPSRCGMPRRVRNSSSSRDTPAGSTAWPSARTANAWPVWLRPDSSRVGKVWMQTGQELRFPQGARHDRERGVQPGRQTLASAPMDGKGLGCRPAGTPLPFKGGSPVWSVAFSPDGKRLRVAWHLGRTKVV